LSVALLDVNVLLALLWEGHAFHQVCAEWFRQNQEFGWATCPVTEAGCARIMSNPAFSLRAPAFGEVLRILRVASESSTNHHFWPDDLPLSAIATSRNFYLGHKQITDAYLLALAMNNGGTLVTFDQRMQQLALPGTPEYGALVVIKP
jgi:uncharacterized protein